jgi:periplasmic protein CpxP/Spy
MKNTSKQLIAAGLLAAFGFAAIAQTPPTAAPAPTARGERHGKFDPAKMQEHMARRQAELKQKLQLTPAQETAWTAYTAVMKPPARMQRPDRAEFEKLTTPERIDRTRAMRATRIAEMDKRGDATKTFYAALTPEQKKVFDAETARGHHRGGRHHRG